MCCKWNHVSSCFGPDGPVAEPPRLCPLAKHLVAWVCSQCNTRNRGAWGQNSRFGTFGLENRCFQGYQDPTWLEALPCSPGPRTRRVRQAASTLVLRSAIIMGGHRDRGRNRRGQKLRILSLTRVLKSKTPPTYVTYREPL